jgi:uncharacterized protein (TIGR03437 family)
MRGLVFCLCAGLPALAQFAEFATTAGGSQVYFTTTLRQRDTQQTHDPKLFRLRDSVLSFLSTEACDPLRMTGACGINELQVSSDGAVVAYQSRLPCSGGSACIFRELSRGTLVTPEGQRGYAGRIRISRNGRFLVQHDTSGIPTPSARFSALYNLEAGTFTNLQPIYIADGFAVRVSDEGTILLSTGLLVTREDRSLVPLPQRTLATDMDRDARYVLAEDPDRRRLYVTDVVARRFWQIGPDDRESYDGSISADGQWVLYISVIGSVPQLFFSRTDGSDWRQLTVSDDGVQDSVLSHDGRVALVVTGRGAILRIDTTTAAAQELIGPTPHNLKLDGGNAPGSLNFLTGTGLSSHESVAAPPLPQEIFGTRLTIDGVPMLLYSVSPAQIIFQVPWELPPSRTASLVLSTGTDYFETSIPVSLTPVVPAVHAIVHEDFQALVTNANPASAGEIIHLYATGLGPVTPAVRSGSQTPLGGLSVITTPWEFTSSGPSSERLPADVLFAGLAPGMIGVYQLDVRIPASPQRDLVLWSRHPDGPSFTLVEIPLRR